MRFSFELPLEGTKDRSWERDDGGPIGDAFRTLGNDVYLVVTGYTKEGLSEIPLIRRDGQGQIIETLLIAIRHEHHTPPGATLDG